MGGKKINRTGEEGYNNFGSKMIIVGYRDNTDIDIYFPEYQWTYYHAQYVKFTRGNVKCPYEPRVVGHGYIGEGVYTTIDEKTGINNHCYHTWRGMLTRCYDELYHIKKPTYKKCSVCDHWLNYQNFAEWYYQNYYEVPGEIMNLDKDILSKGNTVYSPDTCVFVPQRINSIFIKNGKCRGNLPIGVYKHKSGKFVSGCSNGDRDSHAVYLGLYDSIEEAFLVYKYYKEDLIREIATKYIDKIPYNLYIALINYNVDIND